VLLHRSTFDLEVVRVAAGNSTPFTLDTEGMVLNQFSVRVANKSRAPVTIVPRIKESKNVTIISPLAELTLTPGQSEQIPLFLRAPQSFFSNGRAAVEINFTYSAGENFERTVTIWGPVK
jgi:hypothetical protein